MYCVSWLVNESDEQLWLAETCYRCDPRWCDPRWRDYRLHGHCFLGASSRVLAIICRLIVRGYISSGRQGEARMNYSLQSSRIIMGRAVSNTLSQTQSKTPSPQSNRAFSPRLDEKGTGESSGQCIGHSVVLDMGTDTLTDKKTYLKLRKDETRMIQRGEMSPSSLISNKTRRFLASAVTSTHYLMTSLSPICTCTQNVEFIPLSLSMKIFFIYNSF